MIQIVETRLVIQRDNTSKDKYYPKVVSFDTSEAAPFSIPTATIEIITNAQQGTAGYISPVRVDDIVRLQVSTKMNPKEKTVWEDVFEGRVRDITSPYSNKNTSTLFCTGHMGEASTSIMWFDVDYTTTHTVSGLVSGICYDSPALLSRLYYDAAYFDSGEYIDYYNADAYQKYVSDVFADLEKLAKYHYYFSVFCTYDSDGNLYRVYLRWRHYPVKMTNKYAVIEGTDRLLSAEFKSSAEELWNFIRVNGDTVTDSEADLYTGEVTNTDTQYTGAAKSSISQAQYGKRGKSLTVTGIKSNTLCAKIAASTVTRFKHPIVSGQVKLLGTAKARLGDLVKVKLPSLEINGAYVDKNYHVYKVGHHLDANGYTTTLDFTKIKKSPEDYIADFAKQERQTAANDVITDAGDATTDMDSDTETSDTSDYGDSGYTDTDIWEDDIADDEYY